MRQHNLCLATENRRCWANVGLMLVYCLQRWTSIKSTLFQCFVVVKQTLFSRQNSKKQQMVGGVWCLKRIIIDNMCIVIAENGFHGLLILQCRNRFYEVPKNCRSSLIAIRVQKDIVFNWSDFSPNEHNWQCSMNIKRCVVQSNV